MTSDDVREALVEVAQRGDQEALQRLCLEHRSTIEGAFASWKSVPPKWRADQAMVERYVATLLAVAEFFARGLGRPELLAHLTGRDRPADDPSPIDRWHDSLEEAQTLLSDMRHDEATALLQAIVDETAGLRGSWVDQYLPVTLGMLGTAHFNAGRVDDAVAPTRRALEICESTGDDEGARAYLVNLHEIHRYRGEAEASADLADQLAERLAASEPARAARYRERARQLRSGEPTLRVVVVSRAGATAVELDQLDQLGTEPSHLEFAFERNRVTLGAAANLLERGRSAAERGELESALKLFERAAALDPYDPDPHYQAGWALAELGRFEDAAAKYDDVVRRAPGWYRVVEDKALVEKIPRRQARGHRRRHHPGARGRAAATTSQDRAGSVRARALRRHGEDPPRPGKGSLRGGRGRRGARGLASRTGARRRQGHRNPRTHRPWRHRGRSYAGPPLAASGRRSGRGPRVRRPGAGDALPRSLTGTLTASRSPSTSATPAPSGSA